MRDNERMITEVAAALEREPSVNLHSFPVHLEFSDGVLTMEGEVERITAKKRALEAFSLRKRGNNYGRGRASR